MELIIERTGWRRSSTEIISSNISDPLPKKCDNTSEKVRKTSGDLDETEKSATTSLPYPGALMPLSIITD